MPSRVACCFKCILKLPGLVISPRSSSKLASAQPAPGWGRFLKGDSRRAFKGKTREADPLEARPASVMVSGRTKASRCPLPLVPGRMNGARGTSLEARQSGLFTRA